MFIFQKLRASNASFPANSCLQLFKSGTKASGKTSKAAGQHEPAATSGGVNGPAPGT